MDANLQHDQHSYATATAAIDAAAQAWVTWRLEQKIGATAVTRRDAEFWVKGMQTALPGGWWLLWPKREQDNFLGDMARLVFHYQSNPMRRTTLSYARVVYLAKQISHWIPGFSSVLVGVDGLGGAVRGRPLLQEADFNQQPDNQKAAVTGQLQRVRDGLHDDAFDAHQKAMLGRLRSHNNTHLLSLVQMIERVNEGGATVDAAAALLDMHSLAHRSTGRVELSPRQQVRYGRRFAGI
ncbi:hypothetical protein JCM3775_000726 [Rhodotorula graminis]